jgi:hypothetical protein
MRATTAYRRLRREVHDVLEVGGDAHPMGRVNGFIIVLIFLNAIAFAADTVAELAGRYCWEFAAFNAFSVIVFTVEYALRIWSAVEIPMLSRLPRWQARLPRFCPGICTGCIRWICACFGCSGSAASSCSCATRRRCRRSAGSLPMNTGRYSARFSSF